MNRYWASELPNPWLSRKAGETGRAYCLALMMSTNSGLREAPPTRKPSTSGWLASSLQVAPVTEPGKGGEVKVKDGIPTSMSKKHPVWFSAHPHLRLEANPLTSINDAGVLSHCIRDVGLKPSPELFMYFLGLE